MGTIGYNSAHHNKIDYLSLNLIKSFTINTHQWRY